MSRISASLYPAALLIIVLWLIPLVTNAQSNLCNGQLVDWKSAEYYRLLEQGWGPDYTLNPAPTKPTPVCLQSDYRKVKVELGPDAPTYKACAITCPSGTIRTASCTCESTSDSTPEPPASYSFTCQPGERHATSEDVTSMKNAGIINAEPGMCWNPSSKTVGKDAGDAKAYLNSLPNKCVGGCQAPPDKAHIDKLDNTFAICAANFFKEYQAKYGPVSISSAFRCGPLSPSIVSCDRTENARAGGKKASNHQLGLAIDVNPAGGGSSYQTLWSFSKANPKLGICFPHQDGSTATGYPDRPHMILGGLKGSEGSACAAMGITKPCNGLPVPTVYGGESPDSPYYSPGSPLGSSSLPPQSSQSSISPAITSSIAGLIRGWLGMQQAPQSIPYMNEPTATPYSQTGSTYTDASTVTATETPSNAGADYSVTTNGPGQDDYVSEFQSEFDVSSNDSDPGDKTSGTDFSSLVSSMNDKDATKGDGSPLSLNVQLINDSGGGTPLRNKGAPVAMVTDSHYVPNTVVDQRPATGQQTFDTVEVPTAEGGDAVYTPSTGAFTGTQGRERWNILQTIAYIVQPFRGRDPHAQTQ